MFVICSHTSYTYNMNVSFQEYLYIIPDFFFFWFVKAPRAMIDYFFSLNSAILKFLSLQLLVSTFFKPWKNEYRQGLVGFSIGMGMFIKTFVILFDIAVLFVIILAELMLLAGFLAWPFLVLVLFIK